MNDARSCARRDAQWVFGDVRAEVVAKTSAPPRGERERKRASLPPHLARDLDGKPELRPLLLLAEDVALLGRGEAALRRYRELIQRHEFARVCQPPLDVVLHLEC